jgi:hypothetical protein
MAQVVPLFGGLDLEGLRRLTQAQRVAIAGARTVEDAIALRNPVGEGDDQRDGVLAGVTEADIRAAYPIVRQDATPNINLDNIQNKMNQTEFSSEMGYSKRIYELDRLRQGLQNPAAYLASKQIDLDRISREVFNVYRKERDLLLRRGVPQPDAERRAKDISRQLKAAKEKQHDIDFPTDVTKQAISKMSA